jgi:hypothetical protein
MLAKTQPNVDQLRENACPHLGECGDAGRRQAAQVEVR